MKQFCFCGQKLPKGGVVVGISVVSLGAAIWTLAWRGGNTGYGVPFWQGWCYYPGRGQVGTNEPRESARTHL